MPAPRVVVVGLLLACFALSASSQTSPSVPAAKQPVLLSTMQQELDRAVTSLKTADPSPYFISYNASDEDMALIAATSGAMLANMKRHERSVDITVRVGNRDLDNTHGDNRSTAVISASLPMEDRPDAIARVLWINTDRMYKRAAQTFLEVKTNTKVRAEEEDLSADFSSDKPNVAVSSTGQMASFNSKEWEDRVRRLSSIFAKYPEIENSTVMLVVQNSTRYFVSSEGAKIVDSRPLIRVLAMGNTRADDGMDLARSETFDASSFDKLASEQVMIAKIEKIAQDLQKLKKAPVVEPFDGPALLSGRAAAVFFHEVVGHRLEGQRQRGENEGQTFTKMIGKPVLPTFLSVEDDPTLATLGGVELSGNYTYDEEGEKGQKVELISKGVLKQFLMSRMPVKGFEHSNGHGRAQDGMMPVGRQGNLIVRSTHVIPDAKLRAALIEETKRQKKPFGLYFEDIAGGFTLTTRNLPQAFQVMPLMVWKVYPDGRPDELVRGVNIIGTPLNVLNRIVLTGEKIDVFNGECGAESGSVPVSAAAPAMLFSEVEVQKVVQGHERPPVLPPPGFDETKIAQKGAN
ncbi:MAG TPA: metallopeptidase TldD-related protein [Candidatus Angelobacter sp.]|jgi:predicted Zn-dependent protease|nr:metallopeptidase TldD-related protein [Candidatus Angelobacter sp.]